MGFKEENNVITLKEFCNLDCVFYDTEVILYDYNAPIGQNITLSEVGCMVDDIPEIFADWIVEYFGIGQYKDASDFTVSVLEITIREP